MRLLKVQARGQSAPDSPISLVDALLTMLSEDLFNVCGGEGHGSQT